MRESQLSGKFPGIQKAVFFDKRGNLILQLFKPILEQDQKFGSVIAMSCLD